MAALPVAVDEVKRVIGEMIKRDGLETVTSSKIRKHLQETFDVEFTDYKKTVDEITKEVIEAQQKDDSGSDTDSDVETSPTKKEDTPEPGNSAADSSDSDDGVLSTDRARPVKKALKRKATGPEDENLDLMSKIKTGRRSAAKDAANKLKKAAGWSSRTKTTTKKDDKEKCKITKGTKLVCCSEELQDLTGQKFMRRCDVVKELWRYMRDNERMDPKDKRFARIEGDPALEKVFKGKKRIQMFGVMGQLGKHLLKPEDIGQDVVDECEEYRERLIAAWEAKKDSVESNEDESDQEEASKDVPDENSQGVPEDETSQDAPMSEDSVDEPPPGQEQASSDSD